MPKLGRWDFKPMITNWISTSSKRREVVEVQVIQQPKGTLRNHLNPFHSNKLCPQRNNGDSNPIKYFQNRNYTATKVVLMGLPIRPFFNQKQRLSHKICQHDMVLCIQIVSHTIFHPVYQQKQDLKTVDFERVHNLNSGFETHDQSMDHTSSFMGGRCQRFRCTNHPNPLQKK